ncbi:MAG: tagaturonate reductase [Clostridiales bacterium]|jgi:tagaturonate reductase|nr:tagaturonate reductase [Clostridiales bacterium]
MLNLRSKKMYFENETVLQFGEGGFLRAFADYFLHEMNELGTYSGKAVVIQPIEKGRADELNAQNCSYHLLIRGMENGEKVNNCIKINSISRAINPYTYYNAYIELAENPNLRIIISNTTEAGIEFLGVEKPDDKPPKSFPAKLTAFLYRRFTLGLPGFLVLPCELIDENSSLLREYVLKYASLWNLGDKFKRWVCKENTFCNTLVDRITPGFPKDDENLAALLESCSSDTLLNTTEPFYLWVIEGNHEDEFPLVKSGLNVIWVDDVRPYKKRKVRILNGAHTSLVPGALLYGLETVGECMKDTTQREYLEYCVTKEILPVIGEEGGNREFADAVFERFENPFIRHRLQSIALNSISKFSVRVLPTMKEYREKFGHSPKGLCFALASLIAFYKKGTPDDSPELIEIIKNSSFREILSNDRIFGEDLSVFADDAEQHYRTIMEKPKSQWYSFIEEQT